MRVYLDHNATTPLFPEAREAMAPFLDGTFGNPMSAHHEGRLARDAVETARARVAGVLDVRPGDIIFTSGATEANNWVLRSFAMDRPGGAIAVSAVEHSSVLAPARALAREGSPLASLAVDAWARVDPEGVAAALRGFPRGLVSVQAANNETGTIQPIAEVAAAARAAGAMVHVDAAQALGRLDPREIAGKADFVTLSAHKAGGPKAIGAVWVRPGVFLRPLMLGGDQERRKRAGTEHVAGIVGFGVAAAIAESRRPVAWERLSRLRETAWDAIRAGIPDAIRNTPFARTLPNTLNLSFPGVAGEVAVVRMDLAGFAISSGSACSSGASEPSHVLLAMGRTAEEAGSSIRISMGDGNTAEDVGAACHALVEAIEGIRSE